MFEHCSQKFKPYEVWYLFDNKGFYDRCLSFGKCPVCKKNLAELKETRKADDKVFYQLAVGDNKVNKLAELNRNCVIYSSQDIKVRKCKMTMPKYLRYGENKTVSIGGKKYQRMNAVSRYGRRECIKDIPL